MLINLCNKKNGGKFKPGALDGPFHSSVVVVIWIRMMIENISQIGHISIISVRKHSLILYNFVIGAFPRTAMTSERGYKLVVTSRRS